MAETQTDMPDEREETGYHWRNWSREQRCRPEVMAHPHTREGLIEAVMNASIPG